MNNLYWRLSLLMFFQFYIWGSWMATLGTYLLETLHFSGREVGFIYGSTAIAASLSPFWVGLVADRWVNLEKLLGGLHLLGAVCLWWAASQEHFGWFYLLMQLNTLCYLPTFGLVIAFSFHHLPASARSFPRVRVWGTIGWVIAGLVLSYFSLEAQAAQLRIAAVIGFIQGLYCFTLPATPPQPGAARSLKGLFKGEMRDLIRDPSLSVMFIALVLICIPSAYYYSFVNPYLNEIGLPKPAGVMTLGQVSEAIVMLLMPLALARIPLRYMIFIGLLAWGGRYAILAMGQTQPLWLYVGIILHGIAYGWSALAAQIYLDTRAPRHLRSTAQGFVSFLTLGVGVLVGSYIAGETVALHTLPDGSHQWSAIWLYPTVIGLVVAFWFVWKFKGEPRASA